MSKLVISCDAVLSECDKISERVSNINNLIENCKKARANIRLSWKDDAADVHVDNIDSIINLFSSNQESLNNYVESIRAFTKEVSDIDNTKIGG